MIIHSHDHVLDFKSGHPVRIVAFGDVHYGASGCNVKRFEENVLERHAKDENVYFLDLGDTFDCITGTDWRFRPHELAPELQGREDVIDAQVEGFADLWKSYGIDKHRLLGKAHGNHEDTILRDSGSNPTERYCYLTKQRNLGYCFFLRLQFKKPGGSGRHQFVIYGHHGFAGGRKAGSSVNAYTDHAFRHPGAQVYLYGHNHQKWSYRVPTLFPNWAHHEQNDNSIVLGNTGTYLMTNGTDVAPGYAEKKGFYPVETGHLELVITPRRQVGGRGKDRNKERTWFDLQVVE